MKINSRNQYIKLLKQLKRWSINQLGVIDIKNLSQNDIDNYELYLITNRQLSISSINNHRQAINKFYTDHNLPIQLSLKSIGKLKLIDTVSESQAINIIDNLPKFYKSVTFAVYHNHIQPSIIIPTIKTQRGHLTTQVLNRNIAKVVSKLGINKRCRIKMIHQSGIIHDLQKGGDWQWIGEQAQLTDGTMKRYIDASKIV